MAAPLKVLSCVEFDAAGTTCVSQVWIDPPTVFPTLTVAQANEVGLAIVGCVVVIRCLTWIREAWTDRIGH